MTKLLIGALAAAVTVTGGYAAAAGLGRTDPVRTISIALPATAETTTAQTTTDGSTAPATTTEATTLQDGTTRSAGAATTTTEGDHVSGPCDEAEHARDPRCTGAAAADDDRSGTGGDDRNDDDDDRSGPNSGQG